MRKTIVLLAKSRKYGNYCVAGIDLNNNKWVRVVSKDKGISHSMRPQDVQYESGNEAEILDVISVPCEECSPSYFQPENVIFNSSERFKYIDRMKYDDLKPFISNSRFIFHNIDRRIHSDSLRKIPEDEHYSLMLIKPKNVAFKVKSYDGRKKIQCSFIFGQNHYNGMSVTDHVVEQKLSKYSEGVYSYSKDCVLVVSLGEMFDWDCCHYKLIATVLAT